MQARILLAAALLVALAGGARGQSTGVQGSGFWEGPGYQAPTWQIPYGYGGYGGYGGTYEGSVLFGLGAFARGLGEHNYYSAMARRELEAARWQYLRNHKQAVTDWFALRKQNEAAREAKRDRPTPEQIARIVEANRPDRLKPDQYEPATGRLSWPAPLSTEEFAEQRAALDAAFARRTPKDAGAGSEFHAAVADLTEKMLAKLRTKSPELTAAQFMAGRKFLDGLKYESLLPADAKALAARE